MQTVARTFYHSSNGDTWLVVRDGQTGLVFVRHEPDPASGGRHTDIPFEEFLHHSEGSPQAQGLWKLVDEIKAAEHGESDNEPA